MSRHLLALPVLFFALGGCGPAPAPSTDGGADVPADAATPTLPCELPDVVETGRIYAGELSGQATLGQGVDVAANDLRQTCLEPPASGDVCSRAQQSVQWSMHFVQDSSSLVKELELSAAAQYGGSVFDASGSLSFATASSITSDSAFLVLDVEVSWAPGASLADARLTPGDAERARLDPLGFVARCGTHYVQSVKSGALFRAVYHYRGVTASERQALAATFSVGGGGIGYDWSASSSLASRLASTSAHYDTSLFVGQTGGSFVPTQLDPASLIQQARCFAAAPGAPECAGYASVTCSTAPITQLATQSYRTASNWPLGARLASATEQHRIVEETSNLVEPVRFALNDVRFRLSHNVEKLLTVPDCAPELAKLNEHKARLEAFIAAAQRKIHACREVNLCGPNAACRAELPQVPSPLTLPVMDPANIARCGPNCTSEPGATWDMDAFGYCNRCQFRPPDGAWPSAISSGAVLAEGRCRYMRKGATLAVRACGTAWATLSQGALYTDVRLRVVDSTGQCPAGTCCSGCANQCCTTSDVAGFSGATFDFNLVENGAFVPPTSPDAVAAVQLYSGTCKAYSIDGHCHARNLGIDVCDVDRVGGCDTGSVCP